MASTWPAGLIVNDGDENSFDGMKLKIPGDQQSAPQAWSFPQSGGATVDYSPIAMFGPTFGIDIEIDAHSTGNGIIPAFDADGNPDVDNNWMGVTMTIANANESDGQRWGNFSHWDNEENVYPDEAGALLVTYYMRQSSGLAPGFRGRAIVESSREDLGMGAPGDDPSLTDISALDYGVGVITHDLLINDPDDNALFTEEEYYYFSVSKTWADEMYLAGTKFAYSSSTVVGGPDLFANPAHVYMITWTPGTASSGGTVGTPGEWSKPTIYMDGAKLGLDTSQADLDALEVDLHHERIIFSATVGSSYVNLMHVLPVSQLMIYQGHKDFSQPEYISRALRDTMDNDNTPLVTHRAKLGDNGQDNSDEVDGVCTIDPEAGSFDPVVGTPVAIVSQLGTPLGLSVIRGAWPATGMTDQTLFQVTGWGRLPMGTYRIQMLTRPGHLLSGSISLNQLANQWSDVGTSMIRTAGENTTEFFIDDAILPTTSGKHGFMALVTNATGTVACSFACVIER